MCPPCQMWCGKMKDWHTGLPLQEMFSYTELTLNHAATMDFSLYRTCVNEGFGIKNDNKKGGKAIKASPPFTSIRIFHLNHHQRGSPVL